MSASFWRGSLKKIIVILLLLAFILPMEISPTKLFAQEKSFQSLLSQGKEFYQNGDYEKAKQTFLEALAFARTENERAETYFQLSLAYYALGENTSCKEALKQFFGIDLESSIDERYHPSGFVKIFHDVRAAVLAEKDAQERAKKAEDRRGKKSLLQ